MQKNLTKKPYFPIKTYTSLQTFLKTVDVNQDAVHVFGTNGLAKNVSKEFNISSIGIDDLFHRLFPSFRTAKTEIYLQAECRKIISKENFQNKNYLLNRLDSIVKNYYLFADLGMKELNYSLSDSRKKDVMAIINILLKNPKTEEFFESKEHYTKSDISRQVVNHLNVHKLIFYEIEYMNFGRMNFIYWLKSKGFGVEFRIPYNQEFPNVFNFWNEVYKVITNLPDISFSDKEKESVSDNRFGSFMQNNNLPRKEREDVSVIEFGTPHDFASYYEANNDTVVSVDRNEVLPIIRNEKAPIYENEIGKFIYYIQFCRVKDGKLILSYETLVELISSGWIKTKNTEGTKALSLLIDLQEYMNGTETIEDIKERLTHVSELDFISKSFDRENAEDTGRNRLKRYMLNPFKAFSFVNQDRYQVTINQLIELVNHVEKVCGYLIPDETEAVVVNDYFNKWISLLEKEVEESNSKVFWRNVFNEKYPIEWEFAIHELLQLIYLSAGSKFELENKIQSLPAIQQQVVQSNQFSTLHLTNLTQMNFPESHKSVFSEFFTYTDLKECISSLETRQKGFIHSLLVDYTVSTNFEKLGVYQLYNVIANYEGKIIFSWINHLKKDGFKNVFLDIIADLYSDGEITSYTVEENKRPISRVEVVSDTKSIIGLKNLKGKIPDIFWLDHDFCSKKFLLTSIIEQQPIYDTDFHHSFLFSKIGKLFSYSNTEREEFRELIYPLFPHWTYTKKDNLIDMEYKTDLRKYKSFENISYPKEMKSLQILRSVYRENRRTKARNQYRKDKDFKDKDLIDQFKENLNKYTVKAEPGNHCKMCPHLSSCTEGMYAIDNISH